MSTVDVVVVAGGRPANFCDLGGGGSAQGVVDALEVIARDEQVRSILFNIFGGITRCDEVARGILTALEQVSIDGADRRAARRHERRGGPRACSPRRAPRHSRRADDARRRPARGGAGGREKLSDPWSERAQLYRDSKAHSEGADLDLVVEWAAGLESAIDVATGGGHVARRLREAGLQVVSSDPSPGMQPDVICFAEDLPFADASFDLAVTRVAAHHFADVRKAVAEMARVASRRVVVVDTLYGGEAFEEAEKLRDPSHVRNYTEEEWRGFFDGRRPRRRGRPPLRPPDRAGAVARAHGCTGEDARRVRELLADRIAAPTS